MRNRGDNTGIGLVDIIMNLELSEIFNLENMLNHFLGKEFYL